ncbi:uncharacterized protein [Amphiura filiformis]|uniref:uncharacterized protein n=1 Tax=Amphiura filiformis TaxID=82378 RepID=UPI003B21BA5C
MASALEVEEINNSNLQAALVFIDFKKAFDTIYRRKMLDILRAYGIPEKLVAAIGNTYENTVSYSCPCYHTRWNHRRLHNSGWILDYALRKALHGNENRLGLTLKTRKSRRIGPQIITDLDFADDIALLADSLRDAEELLHLVETAALTVGLSMNAKETKAMVCNMAASPIRTLDGSKLEVVDDFKYLGASAWIGSSEKDFNIRKA